MLPGDLSAYLSETKKIGAAAIKKHSARFFLPAFTPLAEYSPIADVKTIGDVPGVYALYDSQLSMVYFGQAKTKVRTEIRQTLNREVAGARKLWGSASKKPTFSDISTHFSAYSVVNGDDDLIHDIEALVIRLVINGTFNAKAAHFKRK